MTRQIRCILWLTSLLLGVGGLLAVGAQGRTPARATAARTREITSSEAGVQFTKQTVTVSRAVVQHNLLGISARGVFEFKQAAGPLASLHAGSVMLLQGSDALVVTGIAHAGSKLLVSTKAADLTQLISSGHITFNGPPNFEDAVLQKIVEPTSGTSASDRPASRRSASEDFVAPAYPYVGSAPGSRQARAASGSLSIQGSSGVFGYSITFTPASPGRVNVTGTICLGTGSICGNGPATGVDAEINMSGYVDMNDTSGGITVSGGSVTGSDFDVKGLATHLHFTYTVVRGDGSTGNADPPVLHIPVGLDYTLPGTIPLYVKIQLGVIVKLGVSSKNSTVHGGIDIDTTGSDDLTQHGKGTSGSESGDHVHGTVLDQSDGGVPASITPGPAGVVVAIQFPKIGVGLGYTAANGIAYVDVITSIGQTTGAAIAGLLCSSFVVDYSIGYGFEAQIGGGLLGLAFASPRKVLYPPPGTPPFSTQDPGCPAI